MDAFKLDQELYQILYAQLTKAFTLFQPGVIQRIEPEIEMFVKLVIYGMSVFDKGTTYGNKLQNLRFISTSTSSGSRLRVLSRTQKYLLGLVSICGTWLWERLSRHAILKRWSDSPQGSAQHYLWKGLSVVETCLSLLNCTEFFNLSKTRCLFKSDLSVVEDFFRAWAGDKRWGIVTQ